jgi:hypothetical protein
MTKSTLRKSTLSFFLVLLLTAGISNAFAQHTPAPTPPSQPTPDGNDPGGGAPDPTCNGGCLVAIH